MAQNVLTCTVSSANFDISVIDGIAAVDWASVGGPVEQPGSTAIIDRKATGGSTISFASNSSNIYDVPVFPTKSWPNGGTPTASFSGEGAISTFDFAAGFYIEAVFPATTTKRKARLWVATYDCVVVTSSATLSDGSVGVQTNTTTFNNPAVDTAVAGYIDVEYAAASAGQTLTIRIAVTTTGAWPFPNVAAYAAAWRAIQTITGTGALTSPSSAIAGSGTVHRTGTGALNNPSSTLAGTGTVAGGGTSITGTGGLSSPASTIAGAGSRRIFDVGGTVALLSPSSIIVGAGTVNGASGHITGTGGLTSPVSTIAGSGVLRHSGSGGVTLPSSAIAGNGITRCTGSGALATSVGALAGSGVVRRSGTGAITSTVSTIAGAGIINGSAQHITGSGSLNSPTPSAIAGSGARHIFGVGALVSTSANLIAGVSTHGSRGSGALGLSTPGTINGAGAMMAHLTGTGALLSPSSRVSGYELPPIGGDSGESQDMIDIGIGI